MTIDHGLLDRSGDRVVINGDKLRKDQNGSSVLVFLYK